MRRFLLFGLIVLVLGVLGYPFYQRLIQVNNKQQAQQAFERRVKQDLKSAGGASEWRWRANRETFLQSSTKAKGKTPVQSRFLEEFQFIRGGLPERAPNFRRTDLEGKTWVLDDLRGNWVVLNFWASWCPSCRQEMPSLQRLWLEYRARNFVLLGVNVQEGSPAATRFVESYDINFPVVLDQNGSIANDYRVTGIPETVIISPNGRALGKSIGYRRWDKPAARSFFDRVLKHDDESG